MPAVSGDIFLSIDEALAILCDSSQNWLDISGCGFDAEDARRIAAALPNSSITHLDISNNKIGNEGAIAIAAALPHSMICNLNVNNNQIGNDGAKAIMSALPSSTVVGVEILANPASDSALSGKTQAFNNLASAASLTKRIFPEKNWRQRRKIPLLTPEEIILLARLAPAVIKTVLNRNDEEISHAEAEQQILKAAALAHQNALDVKPLILRMLPLGQARAWLADKGIELALADFLTSEGKIPQNQFLCRGGIPALFAQKDWWIDKRIFNTALRSLPPEQKALIPNTHTLMAKLSKRGVAHNQQELG